MASDLDLGGSQVQTGPTLDSIAVADFNHDRKLDVALPSGEILLGNGDGTFTAAASLTISLYPGEHFFLRRLQWRRHSGSGV